MIQTTSTPLSTADASLVLQYLQDEIALQEGVLGFLRRKEETLIKQNAEALATLMAEGEPMLRQVEELTQRRVRVLTALGRRLGFDADRITLSMVIASSPESSRKELNDAQTALKARLTDVGLLNRRINVLIRHALDVNRGLVNALFGSGTTGAAPYGPSGRQAPTATPTGLNREL